MYYFLEKLLIPKGGKINKNYIKFVIYSGMSNFMVSAQTSISTHNMLMANNIDNDSLRTLNYIGKDIFGQIGCLVYMNSISSKIDEDPEIVFYKANFLQQTSFIINCSTPFLPEYFIYIAGFSNILCNISFMSFGSISAKSINEISLCKTNIGELYTKISLFNTITSTCGLSFGILLGFIFKDTNNIFLLPLLGYLRLFFYKKSLDSINIL